MLVFYEGLLKAGIRNIKVSTQGIRVSIGDFIGKNNYNRIKVISLFFKNIEIFISAVKYMNKVVGLFDSTYTGNDPDIYFYKYYFRDAQTKVINWL